MPPQFADRNLYVHNPSVTLMRTTPEECAELGRRIAAKLCAATGPTVLFIPLRGVSLIDAEGQPFHDPEADAALFEAVRAWVDNVEVIEIDCQRQRRGLRRGDGDQARRAAVVTGDEARARLRATVDGGGVIIGAGAGTGLSAKCAQDGGADLIIIYNSGRYRMAGRGSLAGLMPYGDANAIVMDMAREVLPVARDDAGARRRLRHRPVPADGPLPATRCWTTGFAGVQNFPTVGLIDGTFRINLEETGMSYALEVEMIREAASLGLLTVAVRVRPRAGRGDDRGRRRRPGPAHGPDHEGHDRRPDGQDARPVRRGDPGDARRRRRARTRTCSCSATAARSPSPRTRQYVLERTEGIVGFFGASSMERLPTEVAMTENMRRFKELTP